jgi:lipopolysaccharide transport protein LptA
MFIKFFIYTTLAICLIALFKPLPKNYNKQNKNSTNTPLLVFKDATMYTLNDKKVTQIIKASKVNKYENKEEIIKGTLISRVEMKNNQDLTDIISANNILKIKDDLVFNKDVTYLRDNFISFKTTKLNYNLKTKIAKNRTNFIGKYYNNQIQGKNLYINIKKEYIKIDQIKLKLKSKNYEDISYNINQTLEKNLNKTSYFTITSKEFRSNMKEDISIFKNSVNLTQNNSTIKANKIKIYTKNINNTKYITKYIAQDNISFDIKTSNKHYIGSSQKIEYNTNTKIYTFLGKTNIEELVENRKLTGNKIVIDTQNHKSKITGTKSKPIRFTITPNSEKSNKIKEDKK